VSEAARQRFLASRRAVIAAAPIAAQFGWQVGDPIPIRGDIWPKEDGSWDWEFVYAGAYSSPPGSRVQPMFLIRSDYFMESVIDWAKHQATSAVLRVHEDADPQAVIDAIDLAFENSSDPTKSLSEDDYTRQFANQLGDIGLITTLILVAVFFTLLLLTANVVSLGFQERVPELAVLKTLGFQDGFVAGLVLGEALLLCIAGAAAGVAAGFALEPSLNANLGGVLGRFDMAWRDAGAAITIAPIMGLMVGLPAAAAAQRLSIVRALQVAR
jgi:putative ABC transport system permease protein